MVSFSYVEPPDIPEGMTIREWRARWRPPRRRRWFRIAR
jgi:hypothetical protein